MQEDYAKTYRKSWFDHWWMWLIIIIVILVIKFNVFNSHSISSKIPQVADGVEYQKINKRKNISFDGDNYHISNTYQYHVNYANDSWKGGDFKVDKVIFYKFKSPKKLDVYRNEKNVKCDGFVELVMEITAEKNINIDDGIINLSNMQVNDNVDSELFKSDDVWNNELRTGQHKTISVITPIQNLSRANKIKKVGYHFDVSSSNIDNSTLDKRMNFILKLRK